MSKGMVWIISRYYNRDECMTPLLERIAWEICNKVSIVINVRKILRDTDGVKKIEEGKQVLDKWKDVRIDPTNTV
jgi:dynein heavy chain